MAAARSAAGGVRDCSISGGGGGAPAVRWIAALVAAGGGACAIGPEASPMPDLSLQTAFLDTFFV